MGENTLDIPGADIPRGDIPRGNQGSMPGIDVIQEFKDDRNRRRTNQDLLDDLGITTPIANPNGTDLLPDLTITYDRDAILNPRGPRPLKEQEIDATNFDFAGRNGTVSMRRSDDGNLTYSDSQGTMTSFDGRTWLRENGDVAFQGTIRYENGSLVRENNFGVRTVERPDGSETRSITTSTGERVQVHTSAIPLGGNENDRTITVIDSSGTFVSTDGGRSYTGRDEQGRFNLGVHSGGLGIDDYGNYWTSFEHSPNNRTVEARTPEAERYYTRLRDIEMRHGVSIAPPDLSYPAVAGRGVSVSTRQPTMLELDALDRALSRSTRQNNDGLSFAFLRDNPDARSLEAHGRYVDRETRYIEIFDYHNYGRGPNGIEGVIDHEIAHHEQAEAARRGGRRAASLEQLYEDMGWQGSQLRDRDNNLWTYNPRERNWTSPSSEQPLTREQMRERARVRPPSGYFTAPWEMHAEATRLFRTDRENLMRENPDLYARIRTHDQDEIDARHGTDESGRSRMIRDLDGRIIANTREDQQRIRVAEREWQANIALRRPKAS